MDSLRQNIFDRYLPILPLGSTYGKHTPVLRLLMALSGRLVKLEPVTKQEGPPSGQSAISMLSCSKDTIMPSGRVHPLVSVLELLLWLCWTGPC